MKRYGKDWHKRAFVLYASGWSVKKIAKLPGFPSERQLRSWKGRFNCDCPFHNWDLLVQSDWKSLVSEEDLRHIPQRAREQEQKRDGLSEKEREALKYFAEALQADLPESMWDKLNADLREVSQELAARLGIEPPVRPLELTGVVPYDMCMVAYALLWVAKQHLAAVVPKDPYQMINLLKIAKDILRNWAPVSQLVPDVDTEEEIIMEIAKPEVVTRPEDIEPEDGLDGEAI